MRRLCRYLVACFVSIATPVYGATPPLGKLEGTITPTAYRLDLTVQPEQARFQGHVEIDVQAKGGETTLFVHGRGLHVTKVALTQAGKSQSARYRELEATTQGVAQLDWGQPLAAGAATLAFDYDAAFGAGGSGLFHLKVGEHWYAWTQFEAIDARAVFPCFDEPRFKTPFTLRITTAPGQLAVSNAAQTREEPSANKLVRHVFEPTAALPTYLVALAVGPFDVVESTVPASPQRPKPLPLRVIATRGQGAKLQYALAQTKPIVTLLEAYFNTPFPFSKLDQIATPLLGGAMENAGAVIYNDTLLVMDESSPVSQRQSFGVVVAHELAHQWFGDLVTPMWWEDLWLNESFAEWLGYRIGNSWDPRLNIGSGGLTSGFNAMELDALHEGRPIQQPILKNGEIESAFDRITYGKGGKVISMVESYLGAERFQKGVQLHMQRFAGRNASSEDFFRSLSDAAGEPRLVKAMHDFVTQQGLPVIEVTTKNKQLAWQQQRYAPYAAAKASAPTQWNIPFCARVSNDKRCALLDGPRGTLEWPALAPGHAALIPNAGGHGYYRFSMADPQWRELLAQAPQLSAGEALAALDSLWAEWRAGALSLPLLIEAGRAFATHADSYVAIEVGERLSALRLRSMLSAAQLPAYERLFSGLYAARLQQLGSDPRQGAYASDSPDSQRLRGRLVQFLVSEARSEALSDTLAQAAGKWIAGDQSAVDRTFLSSALQVWLTRQGVEGLKRLWKTLLATQDVDLRQRMITAIAQTDDPVLARWALANTLKSGLRSLEKMQLTGRIARSPATRELGFTWISNNFDSLRKEVNLTTVNGLFMAPAGFCSAADAERVEHSMRPHVVELGRGTLSLARVLEDIRNCGALKTARVAELQAAFPVNAELDATRR
jgi:aminopeptidase N